MTYKAGYGDIDRSPTDAPTMEQTFDTYEEAAAWLEEATSTLPSPTYTEEEIPNPNPEGDPIVVVRQECSWNSWITNNDH